MTFFTFALMFSLIRSFSSAPAGRLWRIRTTGSRKRERWLSLAESVGGGAPQAAMHAPQLVWPAMTTGQVSFDDGMKMAESCGCEGQEDSK